MSLSSIDRQVPEIQNQLVKSSRNIYRYRKRFQKQSSVNMRKQARFHIKDKNLAAGCRRD